MLAHQLLFVEDDFLLNISTCEFIRDRGIRVIEATDAASATKIIESQGYLSGLVSDIDLGLGADGFEVARRVRAIYPGLPVVFVSGAAAARHKLEGVEGSIFIDKPYHPRQIVDAIAALSIKSTTPADRPAEQINRTLSAAECTERALEFERRSFACADQKGRDEFANLARSWRYVALQAQWQDAFEL